MVFCWLYRLLAALVAPRGLFLTAGYSDFYTNPEGMHQVYLDAEKVYDLLGVTDRIGVAFRPGEHSIELEDLESLLDFGDYLFREIKPARD